MARFHWVSIERLFLVVFRSEAVKKSVGWQGQSVAMALGMPKGIVVGAIAAL